MNGHSAFLRWSSRLHSPLLHDVTAKAGQWFHYKFLCSRDNHVEFCPLTEQKLPRCLICNVEVSPQMLICFEIITNDGKKVSVDALNERHALTLFVKGKHTMTVLDKNGMPTGKYENHPNNVKEINEGPRKYMYKGRNLWGQDKI